MRHPDGSERASEAFELPSAPLDSANRTAVVRKGGA